MHCGAGRSGRRWGAAAALALLILATPAAAAQDAAPAADAETERVLELVRRGMTLDREGDYAGATLLLQEAHAILAARAPVENRWRLNAAISLAHALNELDREAEAAALLAAENQALIDAGQDAAPDAPTVAYALAMILYGDNRYDEAGPPAQRACDLYLRPEHGADPAKCGRLDLVRAAAGIEVEGLAPARAAEAQATRDLAAFMAAVEQDDDAAADRAFDGLLRWMEADGGPDNRDALSLRALRARLWLSSGRGAEARDDLAAVLDAAKRVMGPADPDTLDVLRRYAAALAQTGEAAEADRVLAEAEPEVAARWGRVSAEAARLATARGDALTAAGRYEEALARYRAAGAAAADLPETDEDRVTAASSAAATLILAGRHEDARAVLEPLEARLTVLGVGETSAARQVRLGLAETLMIAGEGERAETLLTGLLEAWPADSRRTLQARAAALADLATLRRQQARLVEGERLATEAVEILKARAPLSLIHIRAQKVRGALLLGLARYGEAGEALRDVASLEARVLGEGHPETALTLISLAEAQFEQGAVEAGQASMRRAIDIAERTQGRGHPAMAGIYNQAALMEWRLGDYEAADRMIEPAVSIYSATLGPENPQTVLARVNRAAIWGQTGRRDEAITEYQAMLDIRRRLLGDDHPDVAALLHTAALQLEPDNAEEMLRRAVEIGRLKLEPDDPDRMLWETGLAWALVQRDRAEEAMPLLRDVGRQVEARPGRLDVEHVGVTEAGRLRDMYRVQVIAAWRVAHPSPDD